MSDTKPVIAMNCPRCGANGTWKAVPTWMAECENGHLFVPRPRPSSPKEDA